MVDGHSMSYTMLPGSDDKLSSDQEIQIEALVKKQIRRVIEAVEREAEGLSTLSSWIYVSLLEWVQSGSKVARYVVATIHRLLDIVNHQLR